MKLETKYTEVEGGIGEKTINSTISQNKLSKLWDMLQNPYKNNIGSIVREQSSNMIDSHTEANVKDAIRIKFGKNDSGYYISFIDVGIGMSTERVENIYSTYLESTKELSNSFIGCYGIGSKSPLSYQDVFYINTIFNGVLYNYMMRKGAEGPAIDLLSKSDTTERNGTEIKIQIKNEIDLNRFLNETISQLHYFKNVIIDTADIKTLFSSYSGYSSYNSINSSIRDTISAINEEYNLIEGKSFIFRTNTSFTNLHLCIGNVYYPIDWSNLRINRISTPIALKFEIGELPVIQTREDIRYTDAAIKTILSKIEEVKVELTELKNKESEIPFEDIYDLHLNSDRLHNKTITFKSPLGDKKVAIDAFIDKKDINPIQIKDFPIEFNNLKESLEFLIRLESFNIDTYAKEIVKKSVSILKTFNKGGALQSINNIDGRKSVFSRLDTGNDYLEILRFVKRYKEKKDEFIFVKNNTNYSVKKNKYIKEVLCKNQPNIYFITHNDFKLSYSTLRQYYINSNLPKVVLKHLFNYLYDNIISLIKYDYDNIVVDEVWYKENTVRKKAEVADYDRSLMAIETFMRTSYNTSWDRKDYRVDIKSFIQPSKNIRILITKEEQKQLCSGNNDSATNLEKLLLSLEYLNRISIVKNRVSLFSTAIRNYDNILKYRTSNSNIYTLKEYLNNKTMQHKVLSKLVTAIKIKKSIQEFESKFNYNFKNLINIMNIFNFNVKVDYQTLNEINNYSLRLDDIDLKKLIVDIDEVDLIANLYDKDLLNTYNKFMLFVMKSKLHLTDIANERSVLNYIICFTTSNSNYRLAKELHQKHTYDDLKTLYSEHSSSSFEDYVNSFNHGLTRPNGYYYPSPSSSLFRLVYLSYLYNVESDILNLENVSKEFEKEAVTQEVIEIENKEEELITF